MGVKEELIFDGRKVLLEWFDSGDYPKEIGVSQVSAFCINEKGEVLIVKNDRGWGFPGGHPEIDESPKETAVREIREEACVEAKNFRLLGYTEVRDPLNKSLEGAHYLQLKFFCESENILDFKAEFETSDRSFVPMDKLPEYIKWLSSPTGSAQYRMLLKLLDTIR